MIEDADMEWFALLDRIEREHEERSYGLVRVLSAAVWTPEPRRGVWGRLLARLRRRDVSERDRTIVVESVWCRLGLHRWRWVRVVIPPYSRPGPFSNPFELEDQVRRCTRCGAEKA